MEAWTRGPVDPGLVARGSWLVARARGPVDLWTRGPVDPWTRGPVDLWTREPVNLWTFEPSNPSDP
jgi:hypothetical protein